MGILAWLGLGLVAGFVASLFVNRRGEGMFMDIVLGVVGAVVGGFIAQFAGFTGITGFDLYSMLIAIGGAILVLFVYHALIRRRAA
jgi:uncharacterized membrane protein YeaQ/YmgE (transglycosylase-associated protein family)